MDAGKEWIIDNTVENLVTATAPFVFNNRTEGGLQDYNLTTEYQNITKSDGYLLMLPQSLAGEREGIYAKLKVYVITGIGDETHTEYLTGSAIEFKLETTAIDWKQGEAINYMINIDLSDMAIQNSTIEAKVVEWDLINAEPEILQRELNATRLSAKVWGGAVTRVFFWSNQPYVWIENSEIYKGDDFSFGDKITTGDTEVNKYFRNVGLKFNYDVINAKTTTADRVTEIDDQYKLYNNVTNFHYDYNATKGEGQGYFDVENVVNQGIPINENYHVFLCASNEKYIDKPLRRSIRLNHILEDIPASDKILMPYVGTFHRHSEFGERIITWNNDTDWTAVVIDKDSEDEYGSPSQDYKWVRIDRNISPALEAGILYTQTPGNAEDYEVSPWSNDLGGEEDGFNGKRWVNGTGKIYLRVGWCKKDPIPSAGNRSITKTDYKRNKYALIHVYGMTGEAYKALSSTEKEALRANPQAVLYIRKGEEPDYIFRNGEGYFGVMDPMGGLGNNTTRDAAAKWSPYNLTTPTPHKAEFNYFDYQLLGYHGAVFAKYPTQSGVYFRWGETRAISSLNTDCGGFSMSFNNYKNSYDYPEIWIPEQMEVCPKGYRVPQFKKEAIDYKYPTPLTTNVSDHISNNELIQSLCKAPQSRSSASMGREANLSILPYSEGNYILGYYADGFYDRGKINTVSGTYENHSKVSYNNESAYSGTLVFNDESLAALFIPFSGSIQLEGATEDAGSTMTMMTSTTSDDDIEERVGKKTFWQGSSFYNEKDATNRMLYFPSGSALATKENSYNYRCVKDDVADNDDYYSVFIDLNVGRNEWYGDEGRLIINGNGSKTVFNDGFYFMKAVKKGDPVTLPNISGLRIKGLGTATGWSTSANGPKVYELNAIITPASDMKLYVKW